MKDVDKTCFLDALINQVGLFGDTVEGFAQQFSAVEQQTEVIQHILPLLDAPSTAAPGNRPQSARRGGRPPASIKTALQNRHLGRCFFFCSAAGSRASGTHFFKERAISFSSGFSVPRDDSVRCIASSLSPTTHLASSQEGAVRRCSTSPCTSSQSHLGPREFCKDVSERAAFLYHPALLPFAAPAKRWSRLHGVWRRGSCCPAHLTGSRSQFDSAMGFSSPGDLPSSTAFSRLRWQSSTPLSCARRLLSSWQRMPVPYYLLHCTQERRWSLTNPGSASLEPGFAQAPIQDADTQAHNKMHPAPGLGLQQST